MPQFCQSALAIAKNVSMMRSHHGFISHQKSSSTIPAGIWMKMKSTTHRIVSRICGM